MAVFSIYDKPDLGLGAVGDTVDSDEIRNKPIPSNELWEALNDTLNLFGPNLKETTLTELEKNGIELASGSREIHDILRVQGFNWLANGKDSCWMKLLTK